MVTLTDVNEILKIDYIEVVRDVLNSSTVLNHRLEKDFESVQGDRVYIGLNVGRNMSFASAAPSTLGSTTPAPLPTAGEQSYAATTFQIPEMYGRLTVRERDIKASRNSKGALIRVLDTEMRHLIRDSKNSVNKMNYNDGSGSLAVENGGGASATRTVLLEHQGAAGGTVATSFGTRLLEKGMKLNTCANRGGTETVVGAIVSSVTNPTTVVMTGSVTFTDTHHICVAGSSNNDQMGLLGIVDDSAATYGFDKDLQGIDRDVPGNEFWQANVMRNANTLRDVTLNMYQEAIDTSEIEGDGEITCFLTTYGIRRETLGLLVADKRFVAPYEMDLDGGFRALSYNGIPIIPDRHAPKHMIFGLDEPTIRFYQMSDWEWMEEDGAVLSRQAGVAAYEATLFLYREMACTDPKNSVRIDDLNDPT